MAVLRLGVFEMIQRCDFIVFVNPFFILNFDGIAHMSLLDSRNVRTVLQAFKIIHCVCTVLGEGCTLRKRLKIRYKNTFEQ